MIRDSKPARHVLVTGFGPFVEVEHNPSQALLDLVPDSIGGRRVEKAVLSVDSQKVRAEVARLYAAEPALVVHTGVARERALVTVERVALNVLDFDAPDEGGHRPVDQPIHPGQPLALMTRLPYRAVLETWEALGIPGDISNSAGTFLCNQVMFEALYRLPPSVGTGFIHVAPRDQQSVETAAEAVVSAVEVALGIGRTDSL